MLTLHNLVQKEGVLQVVLEDLALYTPLVEVVVTVVMVVAQQMNLIVV